MKFHLWHCATVVLVVFCATRSVDAQQGKEPTYEGKSLDYWIKKLKNRKPFGGNEAVEAVVKIGEPAIPSLINVLHDGSFGPRVGAIMALKKIGPAVIPPLLKTLKSKNKKASSDAARILNYLGPRAKIAVPALIEQLAKKETRAKAAWVLAGIGPHAKKAVPSLRQHIDDPEPGTRIVVCLALWSICQDQKVFAILIRELSNEENSIRAFAANHLGFIGPSAKPAVPALIKLLDDSDILVYSASLYALGRIGPDAKAAVPKLVKMLNTASKHDVPSVASTLGDIGPAAKPALPILRKALKQADFGGRLIIEEAIKKIEGKWRNRSTPN